MGRHSPSYRRHRSHRSISPPPPPPREKPQSSTRSTVLSRSGSPDAPPSHRSRSPSPRTKRLKRIQSERESKREHDRSHSGSRGRDSERETVERKERKRADNDDGSRGRDSERETVERKERKRADNDDDDDSGRNGRSSRSKHERSPEQHHNGRSRHRSQSPHRANSKPRDEVTNSRGAEMMNEEDDSIMKMKAAEEALEEKQKVKPSFELSGKLAAETNRVRGVTLLFNEPPEARKPDIKWRLYVFKTGEMLNEPLYIHRQSCYLFGRERRVADVPTDHPSCSKQHAVIQFRQIEKEQPDGTIVKQTRPYIMDLGSTNKTFVNDSPIEPQRYYELREQDTIKFGNSSREYVLLHENSAS
ncbi:FHA domain-containing protein DDL [Trifolium pratense]|uniref:FHA domain-containing protein DDL n=1 Tax=Trifolium pratense TaxID=57577 RepID=UPI001E69573E|nr:FHA domain-containing protein DDL [Trifolium pratense]XP_045824797.1 FHA domain-containing protein DDL [Trifolium pratense]